MAAAVASFVSQYSPSDDLNLYSPLMLFPCFQSLRFEKFLARLKGRLRASRSGYPMLYDVSALLNATAIRKY